MYDYDWYIKNTSSIQIFKTSSVNLVFKIKLINENFSWSKTSTMVTLKSMKISLGPRLQPWGY